MPDIDLLEMPLVLLSNRGPVTFDRDPNGRTVNRGAGGLVSALSGLAEHLDDAVWVCGAATQEDVVVAREAEDGSILVQTHPGPLVVEGKPEGPAIRVRLVATDPRAYADFYSVWSNPILWFIQHGLYGRTLSPVLTQVEHDAFENGYAAVNRAYAEAVVDEVRARGGKALVLLQDYHFYLVAEHVREQCPDVVLTHFVHIPWPGPDEWRVLPADIRERLLRGLLGSDVVGFHTRRYARNFVLCAQELLGLPVDLDALTITVDDRTVRARYYPISVDPAKLDSALASEEVAGHEAMLRYVFLEGDRQLIVRVDRTDPSKNVVRGFLAFGTLLDQHPELVGQVSFLALLQPSRTDVPEYADYIVHHRRGRRRGQRPAHQGRAPAHRPADGRGFHAGRGRLLDLRRADGECARRRDEPGGQGTRGRQPPRRGAGVVGDRRRVRAARPVRGHPATPSTCSRWPTRSTRL